MVAHIEGLLTTGPARAARGTIILAHGAGAPMDSPFMEFMAAGLAERKFRVVRFEFPYMQAKRDSGRSKPPDREPVLRQTWLDVIEQVRGNRPAPGKLLIGGKSMGGRIASLIADAAQPDGLICLGYPFHPTGRPEKLRVDHLRTLKTPALIVQGERDPFGTREEVTGYKLPRKLRVHWLTDGDHSFKPRKSSGATEESNWTEAIDAIEAFVGKLEA